MNFRWVIGEEIAACSGPGYRGRDVAHDLSVLATNHIGSLLRLAEEHECSVTAADLEKAGIRDCCVPVADGGAPKPEQIARAVSFVMNERSLGRRVAVSCGAGCGRTGTILACYLITLGHTADTALDLVIQKQPCSKEIRDRTPQQVKAISEFERRFRLGEVAL